MTNVHNEWRPGLDSNPIFCGNVREDLHRFTPPSRHPSPLLGVALESIYASFSVVKSISGLSVVCPTSVGSSPLTRLRGSARTHVRARPEEPPSGRSRDPTSLRWTDGKPFPFYIEHHSHHPPNSTRFVPSRGLSGSPALTGRASPSSLTRPTVHRGKNLCMSCSMFDKPLSICLILNIDFYRFAL